MDDRTYGLAGNGAGERRVSRRVVLRTGLGALAALPLLAACGGQQPSAPAPKADAKPTEAPKPAAPAATTAPAAPAAAAKPTEAPKPAAPAATTAPVAATKPTEAAKPATAAIAEPKAPAFNKAKINGKLTVIQALDFHPDHNKLVEDKIREFATKMDYPLDHSYISAFAGTGNPVQKLVASVQAGDAPDLFCHSGIQPAEMKELEAIEDVDALMKDIIKDYGKVPPTFEKQGVLDGKWWNVPHFSRAGGWWAVEKHFKEAGIDIRKDLSDFDKLRDAAMKTSKPGQELWGWGITANRSGDGVTTVRLPIFSWGGQLTDETGQIVVLNKEPYRTHTIAALNWLKETYTDPKWAPMLPPGVQSWTDPSNNEAYLAGKLTMSNNGGTMFAKAVVDKNPIADDTWLLRPIQGMGPGARTLAGAGDPMRWFIMKGAKNREAAEQLIKYLVTPDVQRDMWKISPGYVYPAYEWGWEDPVLKENKYAQHVTEAWQENSNHPSAFTNGSWPGPPTAWTASLESSNFWTDMFGDVLSGKSVEQAVKDSHDKAVRVFKEFGAKGE